MNARPKRSKRSSVERSLARGGAGNRSVVVRTLRAARRRLTLISRFPAQDERRHEFAVHPRHLFKHLNPVTLVAALVAGSCDNLWIIQGVCVCLHFCVCLKRVSFFIWCRLFFVCDRSNSGSSGWSGLGPASVNYYLRVYSSTQCTARQ